MIGGIEDDVLAYIFDSAVFHRKTLAERQVARDMETSAKRDAVRKDNVRRLRGV